MKAGLAVSSVVHILAGVLLFFLVAQLEVPTPPDPPHVDIEIEHGEGYRSNPGSSPENPPGGAPQGAQSSAPSQRSSPQIDQSPTKSEPSSQNSRPPQPLTEPPDAMPQTLQPPPAVPDAEPVVPQAPDQNPRASASPPASEPSPPNAPQPQPPQVQLQAKPTPPFQPATRPQPSQPGRRSPQSASPLALPTPPQPKSELEVRLGDGVGQSTLIDRVRPSEPSKINGNPPYPEVAQRRGMQGTVVLRFQVSSNGTVLSAEIVESSGYPLLDSTAQNWVVKTYRFKPALLDGKPVVDIRQQAFIFVLE